MSTNKKRDPEKEAELVLRWAERLGYAGTDTGLHECGTRSMYIEVWYHLDKENMIRVKLRFSDHPVGVNYINEHDSDIDGHPPEFISVDPGTRFENEGLMPYQAVALLAEWIGKKKPAWVIQQENKHTKA